MNKLSNQEIILLIKQGDVRGLQYLYDHYSPALFGVISRIVQSDHLSEEVLQDTFVKIWSNIDQYDSSKSRLFTWMYQIARNNAIDLVRSRQHSFEESKETLDVNLHSEKNVVRSDMTLDLEILINQLEDSHKNIVENIYIKGYTHQQTADQLNLPLGTVKSRLRKGLQQLRDFLKSEGMNDSRPLLLLLTFLNTGL